MSPHTLDTYWRRVKQKLGIKTQAQAVHRIYQIIIELRVAQAEAGARLARLLQREGPEGLGAADPQV